jgi:glycosyltransferase involved in cell wall biosynthesis
MPRLLIHFARYGPYHHARLRSAHEVLTPHGWEVIGLETAGTDATYAWDETKGMNDGPKVVTAFPGRVHEEITAAEYRRVLLPLLDSLKPDAMAIAGWGSTDAQMCLAWCRKNDVRRIVMSETRAADGKRVWWKELIKRYLISRFNGALVGGKSHRDYLISLGMPPERIAFGYNMVDNEYFRKGRDRLTHRSDLSPTACDANESACGGPAARDEVGLPYFLASNRFIERKNLSRLIEAYARYAHRGQGTGDSGQEEVSTIHNPQSMIWNLCLLGDGEQKPTLIAQCHEQGLHVIESAPWESVPQSESPAFHSHPTPLRTSGPARRSSPTDPRLLSPSSSASPSHLAPLATSGPARRSSPTVYFPGFHQIEELPRFYAHAGCFIHPALEEPWGLVINEAMACGLPILSSNNVGAAEELVDDGVNGWKFDPTDVEEMAGLMDRVSAFDFPLSTFSSASRLILEERCPTRAFGEGLKVILEKG